MFPDLFSIGPFTLHTYGLFVAMGFFAAIMVTLTLGKAEGLDPKQITDMGFYIILAAILGSRAMYVLMNFSHYMDRPLDSFKIWEGGLVFSGGIVAALLTVIAYVKRHRLSFLRIGDLWAPGLALGQGIGRIGCLMAGCCYGRPTNGDWGIVFTNPRALAPLHIPLHPTQIYASLSGFLLFGILLFIRKKKQFQGQVVVWFLILHSTARLFMERFRGDDRGMLLGSEMTLTQGLTLLILVGAIVALFVLKRKRPL
ncbi:MAG: prolipoprotein diacylglyceryl transferase [Deltaproteobacteria bacterium]|nr:prolipoprotein diacylglyceryl transferase [Deltaproteobacteria bacterium]MCF8118748.1 prolipoprotein diacylglyceryl transferase [Deltaproteobacteria bacterium]